MDTIQREKSCIQKREQTARTAFSLLLLIVFVITASSFVFLRTTRVAQMIALLGACWPVLSFGLLFFLCVNQVVDQFAMVGNGEPAEEL